MIGPQVLAGINEPACSRLLGDRLEAGNERARSGAPGRWDGHGGETFVVVWIPSDPHQAAEHWLVDLGAGKVTFASRAAQENSDWDVVGSADAWEQVLSGRLNLSVALRACQLRYCDGDDAGPLASETRLAMLADLLSITTW